MQEPITGSLSGIENGLTDNHTEILTAARAVSG
jgi:hypothetical protein